MNNFVNSIASLSSVEQEEYLNSVQDREKEVVMEADKDVVIRTKAVIDKEVRNACFNKQYNYNRRIFSKKIVEFYSKVKTKV